MLTRKRKYYLRNGGMRKDITNNERRNLRVIIGYERNPNRTRKILNNTHTIQYRIKKIIEKQQPLKKELVVWRGQWNNKIDPESWFSTSLKKDIARSYGGKSLFKIHLELGIQYLDLYKYYDTFNINNPSKQKNNIRKLMNNINLNLSDDYSTFAEIIVQEGGTFWKDKEHTQIGFKEIGNITPLSALGKEYTTEPVMKIYETYYSV